MTARLTSLRPVLLALWEQRDRNAPWGRRALAALFVLSLAAGLVALPDHRARVILASCVFVGVVFGGWLALVASLLEQNHPHAARFVPGHLQRLREAALLAWGVAVALLAGLFWLALGHFASLPAVVLVSAAACAYTAWAMRSWPLWFVVWAGPALFGALDLRHRLAPLWHALRDVWLDQPWSVTLLGLLALGWAVVRLFGNGNEAHRAAYASRTRMRKATRDGMTGNRAGLAAMGKPGEFIGRPFEATAAAWLAHVLRRATPAEASVMQRTEIVLHGMQHWLRQLMGLAIALVLVGLGFTIAFQVAGPSGAMNWTSGGLGMAIGLCSMGLNPGFALTPTLWHSRREQALLVLLPGMPQGQRLNRAIAWMQMRHFLIAWGLTTAFMAVLSTQAGDPALMGLPIAALPIGVFSLLRPPARLRAPRSWTAALPIFSFILIGGLLYALYHWLGATPWLPAAISLALSAALGVWGWRRICAAPQAMPAGRLG